MIRNNKIKIQIPDEYLVNKEYNILDILIFPFKNESEEMELVARIKTPCSAISILLNEGRKETSMLNKIRDLLGKMVTVKQSPERSNTLYLEIGKRRWVWIEGTYAFCYKWKT